MFLKPHIKNESYTFIFNIELCLSKPVCLIIDGVCICCFLLCFVSGNSPLGPCPPEDAAGGCAEGVWVELCAVDSGCDGFGGCKAQGCGLLLVKTEFSARPFLCFHDVAVCSHNPG